MGRIESREEMLKQARSSYDTIESREEMRAQARQSYEPTSSANNVDEWFRSSAELLKSAQNRLSSSNNYKSWKEDKGNTASAVNQKIKDAREVEIYLMQNQKALGNQYDKYMRDYNNFLNELKKTSEGLKKEKEYYSSDDKNVLSQLSSEDTEKRIKDLESVQDRAGGEMGKLGNNLRAWGNRIIGDEDDYEKYKKKANEFSARKEKINELENLSYNKSIEEKMSKLDQSTVDELMSIPSLNEQIELEKTVGNEKQVYEYHQRIKKAEDKARKAGINPAEIENYAQYQYDKERSKKVNEEFEKFGKEHPIVASVASVPMSLSSGMGYVDALAQKAVKEATGSRAPINYNTNNGLVGQGAESLRGGVMAEHDWNVGDFDAFDFLYGTGMSGVDSLAAAGMGNLAGGSLRTIGAGTKAIENTSKMIGGAVLGGSAATSAMNDMVQRGGTEEQALASGLTAGVFENLFESVSIGNFNKLKEVDPRSLKDVALNLAKTAGVNASEEALTEIANITYDTVANGNLSDYRLRIAAYMKDGMTEAEAKRKTALDLTKQVIEAGAGGALMGLGFGAIGTTAGYLNNRANGNLESADPKGYQGGSNVNYAQALENLNVPTSDAVRFADIADRASNEEALTRQEKKIIKNSPELQQVIKDGPIASDVEAEASTSTDSVEQRAINDMADSFDDAATAKAFISGYEKGNNPSEYLNAFLDFKKAGKTGLSFEKALSNAGDRVKLAGLSPVQLKQAYYAGVNEANNAPKLYTARDEARAIKKGGLLRNYTQKLSNEQAGQVYVIEALAKKYGFTAEIRDTLADGEANGYYDPKKDRIMIALDADEGGYLRTASHELYHYIENWSTDSASELKTYVIDKLKTNPEYNYDARFAELSQLYEGTGSDIDAEIVADSMFDVFDEQTIRELCRENQTLAHKIQSWIQGFIDSINDILKNLGLKSPEIRTLEGDEEALENIKEMFNKGLEESKKNKQEVKKVSKDAKKSANITKDNKSVSKDTETAEKKNEVQKSFSLKSTVEETKDLIAVHNLSEEDLFKAFELGGLASPSFAVVKAKHGHKLFNTISLIARKETIDPRYSANKVYGNDAYTPVFPADKIQYKVSKKAAKKIKDKYYELYHKYGSLARPLYELATTPEDALNREKGISGLRKSMYEDTKLMQLYRLDSGLKKVEPVINRKEESLNSFDKSIAEYFIKKYGTEKIKELEDVPVKMKFVRENAADIKATYKEALINFGFTEEQANNTVSNTPMFTIKSVFTDADKILNGGETTVTEIEDHAATKEKIIKDTDQKAYKDWIDNLTSGLEEKKGIYNGKEVYTDNGRHSFEYLHYEYNLENIVRAMNDSDDQGGSFLAKNILGASAKEFKSIEEIKKESKRLSNLTEEEHEKIRDEFLSRFRAIGSKFNKRDVINTLDFLCEAVANGKTPERIKRYIKTEGKEFINYSESAFNELMHLVNDIRSMPVEYFEAKPKRSVGFDEIALAVIPDASSQKLKDKLDELGITYKEYKAGDEASRLEALNSEPSVKFSLKNTSKISEDNKKLIEENKSQKEYIQALERELSGKKKLDKEAVKKVAKKYLKYYNSSYDLSDLTENLTRIFEYIANAHEISWDEVLEMTAEAVKPVIEGSDSINDELWNAYEDLRNYVKKTPIKLSQEQKDEIAYYYDSYENFRRKNFGKIRFSNKGYSLDSLWGQFNELWPELFPEDTGELEEAIVLSDALESIKPFHENPFKMGIDDEAYDLARRIYEDYYDIPEIKSYREKVEMEYAERYSKREEELMQEWAQKQQLHTEAMVEERAKLEKEYAEKAASKEAEFQRLSEEQKEKYLEDLKKKEAKFEEVERINKDFSSRRYSQLQHKLIEQKAMYEKRIFDDRRNRLAREAIQKHRRSIERNVKTLNRWLQDPGKQKHVPEALRPMLAKFLQSLNVYGDSKSQDAYAWREAMLNLRGAMSSMVADKSKAEEYQSFLSNLDPDLFAMMSTLIDTYQGSAVHELDAEAVAELDTVIDQIRGGIKRANELLANARYDSVSSIARQSIQEMNKLKPYADKIKFGYKHFNMNMLNAYSFAHRLGSAAESVIDGINSGYDEWTELLAEANSFMHRTVQQKDIGKWEKETKTFDVEGGKLKLTISQIMELYVLSNREQARAHILIGGIRPQDTATQKAKEKIADKLGKSDKTYSKSVEVSVEDVSKIISSLSPEERKVADAMQKFLSTNVADWGNKASMNLYGYRKFTEDHYWPIQVNDNSISKLKADPDFAPSANFYQLINIGATKQLQKDASNGLFIKGIFDTFVKHVNEMSRYSALAAPLTDAIKWYNSIEFIDKEDGTTEIEGVKQSIERVFGKEGKRYFEKFLLDLNGINNMATGGPEERLIRNFKIAAVGANLRVAIQQPTAYLRAATEIDMKYLAKGLAKVMRHPKSHEAVEKSPIAKWKSWGFFETNLGITMKQLITGQQTGTEWIRDKSMALAGLGDDLTWEALYQAVKAEVKEKEKLAPGTEDFDVAVNKRFSEIVNKTQVVDTMLHRSQVMRDSNTFTKILTAFKSEPSMSYNLLTNAIFDFNNAKKGKEKAEAQKRLARVAVVTVATNILTAGVAAVVDAFRHDDDEKEWLDLYLEAVGANALDNINLLSAVPYVGDIISMIQGYTVDRTDLVGIQEVIESAKGWYKFFNSEEKADKDPWKLITRSAGGVSKLTGLPISNVLRTFESMYNFFSKDNLGKESSKHEYQKFVEDMRAGKGYQSLYSGLIKKGFTKAQIESGVKAELVKTDPRITEAAVARINGDISLYRDIVTRIKSEGYPQDLIITAINSQEAKQVSAAKAKAFGDTKQFEKLMNELFESGYSEREVKNSVNEISKDVDTTPKEESEKKLYEYKDLKAVLHEGDVVMADEIISYLREHGKDDKAIRSALTSEFKTEYQSLYNEGNPDGMAELRQMLYDLDIGYKPEDFSRWIKELAKK